MKLCILDWPKNDLQHTREGSCQPCRFLHDSHTTKRVSSALALLTPESIIFHAGKNLLTYEITSYVRVAERPLDGSQTEESLLLIRRTSYCCTNSYPAIFFPDYISYDPKEILNL